MELTIKQYRVIQEELKRMEGTMKELYRSLHSSLEGEDFDIDNFLDKLDELIDKAYNLSSEVSLMDENLDPEKTNLPNIDQFFEGDPISDYVKTAIEYYEEGKEELKEAMLKAAERAVEEQRKEEECNCNCKGECESKKIDELISNTINLSDEVDRVLRGVERYLNLLDEYDDRDIDLIRFYLKHVPGNDAYEIDSLSDNALRLVWNRKKYLTLTQ